ncbi:hypothetical protein RFI_29752 [Reticulomyxa filosa]|uniref:Uncharacterized protein n=1 Tax=Reticulomyxa filosa TaxID=46433 RepID=X6M213_RETFI|nr:hypothetical protein RFI_29752 [Reticulomyxa filosa]|eukprot:ETO07641.1 hypothetical protein RFI_29752 [Reticulomyxa filosa]
MSINIVLEINIISHLLLFASFWYCTCSKDLYNFNIVVYIKRTTSIFIILFVKYFFLNQNTSKYLMKILFNIAFKINVLVGYKQFNCALKKNSIKIYKISLNALKEFFKFNGYNTSKTVQKFTKTNKRLKQLEKIIWVKEKFCKKIFIYSISGGHGRRNIEHAEALCKVLRDDQDCKSVEDVAEQTETDWEDVLKKVKLQTATKKRLFNAIKNISKKSNIPIPENNILKKKTEAKKLCWFPK